CRASIGLAPSVSPNQPAASSTAGSRQSRKTKALVAAIWRAEGVRRFIGARGSEVLLEVHALVELGHLFGVAVEHQRAPAAQFADAPLGGLAPARMADLGIDVGVEAVFVRGGLVPGGGGLLVGEPDGDQRLGALETVL